ncbi:hypothetical protein [Tessaracoccus sp. OH4464_COT-324]|uniref:hypothetical protein n=1 Tax=Tessaracoccus sp. OH4464_COT-324 TaxID=2491059 RepID=UPI000F62F312|nr:hypothetical protein [Tessaracoccus sp. OH4464_COT-324]RRD46046.1 hypothetical protein EII42_08830 [Tessaracoccus sp. OH4464_COT-324]
MLTRRSLLLAAAAVAGCAPTGSGPSPTQISSSAQASPATSAASPSGTAGPFQMPVPCKVDVLGYQGPYVSNTFEAAERLFAERNKGASAAFRLSSNPAQELGVTPPDVLHDAGPRPLLLARERTRLVDLAPLLTAPALAGDGTVGAGLYTGVAEAGSFGGTQLALHFALDVHGLWYSKSTAARLKLGRPRSFDELLAMAPGERYLFAWEPALAVNYLELFLTVAVKEAGVSLLAGLEGLAPDAWRHPALLAVLEAFAQLLGTQQLREVAGAAALWAADGGPLFLPGPASALRETKAVRAATFLPAVLAPPGLSPAADLPLAARVGFAEPFAIPADSTRQACGLEFLRVVFSPTVAREFALTNHLVPAVRGTLPQELSPELSAQIGLLSATGAHRIHWRFIDYYGLGSVFSQATASFLRGQSSAVELLDTLQAATDDARSNPENTPLR